MSSGLSSQRGRSYYVTAGNFPGIVLGTPGTRGQPASRLLTKVVAKMTPHYSNAK